jgi:hypothetical protein
MAISKICTPLYLPSLLVLTDGDTKAVDLLNENLNNPFNQINQSVVQATCLLWGVTDDGSLACTDFLDWHRKRNATVATNYDNTFDTIFAGDVLYKDESPNLFFSTAYALLTKNIDSSLWLCHIPRHGVLHSMVVDAAQAAGFIVTTINTENNHRNVKGCPLEDLQKSVTYRMHIHEDR